MGTDLIAPKKSSGLGSDVKTNDNHGRINAQYERHASLAVAGKIQNIVDELMMMHVTGGF
jgi:hypothetical protein